MGNLSESVATAALCNYSITFWEFTHPFAIVAGPTWLCGSKSKKDIREPVVTGVVAPCFLHIVRHSAPFEVHSWGQGVSELRLSQMSASRLGELTPQGAKCVQVRSFSATF